MRKLIIGIGGMTHGGKTTLSKSLQDLLNNSLVISQDNFFKVCYYQYDTLDALHMDRMMADISSWQEDPQGFMMSRDRAVKSTASEASNVFVLIVEGILIFQSWVILFSRQYFLQLPYEICKDRRSSRVYVPYPDPPSYSDGYVWPLYLKNRKVIEETVKDIVFLDGTQKSETLLSTVLADIQKMLMVTQR
uniref:Nicotinamide riboside kinase 1 n=1 Tax=Cyprinus carpio TaxID=7962 RepID=A0A8C1SRE6_CYPCA